MLELDKLGNCHFQTCRSKVVMSGFTQVKMSAFNFRKEDRIDPKDIRNESSRNRQSRDSKISRIQKT